VNTNNGEKTLKPYAQLKAVREGLRFSIGEMAAILGLPKSTYQGYEENRRSIPDDLINKAIAWCVNDREFMSGMSARIDARLSAAGFNGKF